MSDDETPTTDESAAPDAPDAPAEESTAVATQEDTPPVEHGAPAELAEPVTFTRKFLLPFVIPLVVTATIIFFVLNISRIFLASQGAIAVTWATIITVAVLGSGAAFAASAKLRSSSLALMVGGGFAVLLMAGLISIGAASPEGESGPVQCEPVTSKITIDAGNGSNPLRFTFPDGITVKAGCVDISLVLTGSHTLQFDEPPASEAFPELGASEKAWAGTLAAGEYKFHCTIPGHEAGGMVADLVVTK